MAVIFRFYSGILVIEQWTRPIRYSVLEVWKHREKSVQKASEQALNLFHPEAAIAAVAVSPPPSSPQQQQWARYTNTKRRHQTKICYIDVVCLCSIHKVCTHGMRCICLWQSSSSHVFIFIYVSLWIDNYIFALCSLHSRPSSECSGTAIIVDFMNHDCLRYFP